MASRKLICSRCFSLSPKSAGAVLLRHSLLSRHHNGLGALTPHALNLQTIALSCQQPYSTKGQDSSPRPIPIIPHEPATTPPPSGVPSGRPGGVIDKVAETIATMSPSTGETYVAYSKGQELYLECARQAAYIVGNDKVEIGGKSSEVGKEGEEAAGGPKEVLSEKAAFWYEGCKRDKSFNAWAQVTILHIWTVLVRFRAFSDQNKTRIWQQQLVDHFFYDAEEKMEKEYNIRSGSSRSRYLKDLFIQYRGQIAAYDEGLVKSDAVLATALWRNIFDAKPDVSFTKLALVTSYVRRILAGLDKVEDETVCAARLTFGDPRNEAGVVAEESRLVKELEAMPMENGRAPKGGQVTEINPA